MLKPDYHDNKALKHLAEAGVEDGYYYRLFTQRLSREDRERFDNLLKYVFITGYNAGEADERSEHLSIMEEFGTCVTTKL